MKKKVATRGGRVVVGDDDPKLTGHAGLVLVAELDRVLGIASAIDDRVGPIKARRNGQLVARWFAALDSERREALAGVRPTLDLDPTDVEVYSRQKEAMAYNHAGQLVGRPHPVVWAEAGVVVAADLGDGRTDPRPQAPGLIRRAVAGLPPGLAIPTHTPSVVAVA